MKVVGTNEGVELVFDTREERFAFRLFMEHADLDIEGVNFSLMAFDGLILGDERKGRIKRFASELSNIIDQVLAGGSYPEEISLNTEAWLLKDIIPNEHVTLQANGEPMFLLDKEPEEE